MWWPMKTCSVGLSLVSGLALCGCVLAPPMSTETQPMPLPAVDTSWKIGKGFDLDEAKALIEFCTALDYGVDLPPDPPYAAVAEPANAAGWEEIYPYRETLPANQAPQAIGPYGNAWKLYRKTGSDIYVIAIRGTIDTKGSIAADLIATSTPAHVQIQARQNPYRLVSFTVADTPQAETHLGWTYAMAELMFDRDFGILRALHDPTLVHHGSRILITGHSQGAAIATLAHAFLHYAIADPTDKFGLRDSGFTLKSYVFAQPKPGNWQFAMDFSRIAGSKGTGFVINNNLDWVPQTPLSIEFFDEPGASIAALIHGQPGWRGVINSMLAGSAIAVGQGARGLIAMKVADDAVKSIEENNNFDERYLVDGLVPDTAKRGYSVNYAVAGEQVPVFASALPAGVIKDDGPMAQHHGPTYRKLLESPPDQGGLTPSAGLVASSSR
jgi:Lipase (class 3)